jgi:hypothetical protein
MSAALFRRRGSNLALPTTSAAQNDARQSDSKMLGTSLPPCRSSGVQWMTRSNALDGSARSIRLHGDKSLRQVWRDSQTATKITYVLTAIFVVMVYYGIRSLRYHYSQISLNCHIADCTISITPVGWKHKASLTFPRRQLSAALAVKTTYNGTYVSSNPSLTENYNPSSRHNKKYPARTHKSPSVTYKGPDANGHYVSYALVLNDPASESEDAATTDSNDPSPKLVDLSPIRESLQSFRNMDGDGKESWILTFHLFGISHTKRRVRSMMTRIDSYVKRRRHTVTAKESGNPSWLGILCVVFGLLGLFLTLLLGQYVDDKPPPIPRGPGVMRHRHSHASAKPTRAYNDASLKPRATSFTSAYQRATPARFEVKMQPTAINSQKQY